MVSYYCYIINFGLKKKMFFFVPRLRSDTTCVYSVPGTGKCSALVMYLLLIIVHVFLTDISAVPEDNYSNIYTTSATEYALDFNPTTVYQPPFRNLKENIDVKELIETLQEKFRQSKIPVPVAVSDNTNYYFDTISLDDIDFFLKSTEIISSFYIKLICCFI